MKIWNWEIKRNPSGFVDVITLILIGSVCFPFYCTLSHVDLFEIVWLVSAIVVIFIAGQLAQIEIKHRKC